MIPLPDFSAHRNTVLDRLGEDEAVLLFGSPTHLRNGDSDYRYRPDSDVYWLTGWEDPQVAIFLRNGDEPLTMFVQARDPTREVWDGFRPGPEGAKTDFGADAAFEIAEIEKELARLLQGVSKLHYGFARDGDNDAMLMTCIRKAARAARRNGLSSPETFYAPSLLLHEIRLLKNEAELTLMRDAARISGLAHLGAMKLTRPGMHEYQIEAALESCFRVNGSTGPGYTSIVAGGANATVLHYVRNRDPLVDGDLLLVDAGCEVAYYTADITRTWPINGRFTEPQRQVYEGVLRAQLAAIDAVKPGNTLNDVHNAAVRVLTQTMVAVGLLEGEVDDLISDESFKKYYMHGTSHWLGLDVHDVGVYGRDGETRPLVPGMVLSVEPGLYIAAGDTDAPEALRGIGVRIEDDVLVTAAGHEVLTDAVPKSVADLEAICSSS